MVKNIEPKKGASRPIENVTDVIIRFKPKDGPLRSCKRDRAWTIILDIDDDRKEDTIHFNPRGDFLKSGLDFKLYLGP